MIAHGSAVLLPPRAASRWLVPAAVAAALAIAPVLIGKFGVSLLNDIGIGALVALVATFVKT